LGGWKGFTEIAREGQKKFAQVEEKGFSLISGIAGKRKGFSQMGADKGADGRRFLIRWTS